jgi:hypothetical protein
MRTFARTLVRGAGTRRIAVRRVLLSAWLALAGMATTAAAHGDAAIRVHGPGTRPEITFACCDKGIGAMQTEFSNTLVVKELKGLGANVAIAIEDLSPERAEIVRQLNQAGIPTVAWILLPKEQGYYLNADDAAEARERMTAFEAWTRENHLQWAAVGLDIEPNFGEFAALREQRWALVRTLAAGALNFRRMARARRDYAALIGELERDGYRVQTYQMPYVAAERREHSQLADRMLGSVDVPSNEEYLMLYASYARAAGAGIIRELGPGAQGIAIGSTDGDGAAGTGTGPLSWDEFSSDLIVASQFSRKIGVYNLEGCVQQGFLEKLSTMDWSSEVVIPAASVSRAERMGRIVRGLFWVSSHALLLASCMILLIAGLLKLRRNRKLRRASLSAFRAPS